MGPYISTIILHMFEYALSFVGLYLFSFAVSARWTLRVYTYGNHGWQTGAKLVRTDPDLSNRTVRRSNPIEHQSFDCRTQSNIIELTIKFCQLNTIGMFDYRTIGDRTQSNVRLTNAASSKLPFICFVLFEHWHSCSMMFSSWLFNKTWQWLYSTCFTQFEASRDNYIGLVRFCSIILVQKSNSQQNRCSILFDCQTQSNDWSSIGFDCFFFRFCSIG